MDRWWFGRREVLNDWNRTQVLKTLKLKTSVCFVCRLYKTVCGVGGTPCRESREMGVSLKGLKWTNPRPSSLQESIFFLSVK